MGKDVLKNRYKIAVAHQINGGYFVVDSVVVGKSAWDVGLAI